MIDYQAMYDMLFRKITAVIEELQSIQCQTEEMYTSSESTKIRIVDIDKSKNKRPDEE
ncbi:hypothetical protein KM803_10120 [Clostridium tyrobutyricum]|uniref:hypothetical protein n=1 Tax=Clostridium tyrobutyricum TaxID=1519 RepID=UPI001C38CA30|nr:hypothetical protein [Clostridium tyrobutyricum]MBV4431685.1 hypothetical protein [Clostridium tyrobutyricum]